MGIKLQFILIIVIVAIVSGAFLIKVRNTLPPTQVFSKELEFTDTTLIEVDTGDLKSRAYLTYGVRDKGILSSENIVYLSDTVEYLSAKNSVYYGDKLYLDGDVVLHEKDGYKYKTQHAIYDQKTEVLHITSPFVGVKGKNVIEGKTLEYDTRSKKASGKTVGTVFYIPDK